MSFEASQRLELTVPCSRPTVFERFTEACVSFNGGFNHGTDIEMAQSNQRLTRLVTFISGTVALLLNALNLIFCGEFFADPHKATEDLKAFAKLNEQRLYKLLKASTDTNIDLKSLVKTSVRRAVTSRPPFDLR